MSIATLAARISKADRRRHAALAALQPLRQVVNALLSLASHTRNILYQAIDKQPAGALCRRKYASRRDRRRARFFESLLFAEAPRHLIVPRRHAALEALEARELLTVTFTFTPTGATVVGGSLAEGTYLPLTVNATGMYPGSWVSYGLNNEGAWAGIDFQALTGSFPTDSTGSGSAPITIETLQDGEAADQTENDNPLDFQLGGEGYSGFDYFNILETGLPRFCTCNCGCGVVEAKADPATGAAIASDGRGAAPDALSYNSYQRPHPMVNVLDTLSSGVGGASDIETQVTLFDLSGNAVRTGAPVYYSPSGYTAGEQVQFAGQIDATGLADGTYERIMTVTENYSDGSTIARVYTDWVGLENRDSSPYGSGWAPHNIERLVLQSGVNASGASLEDGSGNVFWFQQDPNGNYLRPGDSPQFSTLVKNGDGTFTLTMNDGSTEQFSSSGLLTKSTDRVGNWLQYSYNGDNTIASVQDDVGRTTTFAYSGGYLSSVTDFAGRVTTYQITNGQLTQIYVTRPGMRPG